MESKETPSLHVVFTQSGAGCIREALRQLGSNERVIGFMDDLSFGPIDRASARACWIANELGFDWDEVCREAEGFWAEVTSAAVSLVAWVSRKHATEYSGYLEFVRRMADRPFDVVDASDHLETLRPARRSLGGIDPSQAIEAGLFARKTTLSRAERTHHLELWHRLQDENAPFRVVGPAGLVSAPITHFDDAILTCVSPEWRLGARVVVDAMAELFERPFGQCTGDKVVWSRVLALGDAGIVEVRGSPATMRACEVRRVP